MSLTHRVGVTYSSDAGTITSTTDSYTGDGEANFDGSVAQGIQEVDVAVTVASIKSMVLYSTQAVTLTTNHAAKTVSALTSSSTTATATATSHGYTTADTVTISGAVPAAYNGTYTITVTDTDTFTYTFAGSGTSPATGTKKAIKGADTVQIAAGKQVVWNTDHLEANPLTTNVTTMYATNQGATAASVKIRVLYDATP